MKKKWLLLLLSSLIVVFSCDKDNPVKDDEEDHDHAEAVGMVIFQGETELVRNESGTVTGSIQVNAGETTPMLTIQFIDEHDQDLFVPDSDHHSLQWSLAESDVVTIQAVDSDPWAFTVTGTQAGETEAEFNIFHGDHADFVSMPVPIVVQ